MPIRLTQLIYEFVTVEARGDRAIPHIEQIGVLAQWHREDAIGAVAQKTVSIDPPLLGVFDVVVYDE